jgi:hypothetical protein
MSLTNLTPSQLRKAASLVEKIEKLQNKLNELLGAPAAAEATEAIEAVVKPVHKRKKISAAGIARIRAAQKARWAKVHAAQGK